MCDIYFITKCDKRYCAKVRQVLQSATLLQSATVQGHVNRFNQSPSRAPLRILRLGSLRRSPSNYSRWDTFCTSAAHPTKSLLITLLSERVNLSSITFSASWTTLEGSWQDEGDSWQAYLPYDPNVFNYGPARLWSTPINSDQYGTFSAASTFENSYFPLLRQTCKLTCTLT